MLDKLIVPYSINLGICKPGIQQTCFTIENTWDQEIEISKIATDCSCVSVTSSLDTHTRFTNAILLPKQSITIFLSVHIPADRLMYRSSISITTNQNINSTIHIPIHASLRNMLICSPPQIFCGNFSGNDIIKQEIMLSFSDGASLSSIGDITSSNSDLVKVSKLHPLFASNKSKFDEISKGIIHVEILCPKVYSVINEEIRFFDKETSALICSIPVSGTYNPNFSFTPNPIQLPIYINDTATYSLNCLLRSSRGLPFEISVYCPPELEAQYDKTSKSRSIWPVTVKWKPNFMPVLENSITRNFLVDILVDNNKVDTIVIPITCRRQE